MKKQTDLHPIKSNSLAIVAAIAIIVGTAFSASAQEQTTFKVGDRVWANYGDWMKGEIIEIKDGSYQVHFDNDWKQWVAPQKVRSRQQIVASTEFGTGPMTEEQVLSFVQTKTKNNS